MKTFNEEDLLYIKIPGLRLQPLLESFISHCDLNIRKENAEMGIMKTVLLWEDKKEAEKLFFKNMSLKEYGKLELEEVREKICDDFGVLTLTNIFILGWVYYLGNQLTALEEVEN